MKVGGDALATVSGRRAWTARADSVPGIEAELARIWGAAAIESQDAHLSARMRTSVLTLIAVAERPETEERVLGAIGQLAARHPSRTIVLAPGDPDGPARLDAHIYATCRVPETSGAETCTEQILLRTGGEVDQHLAALIQPLLIHDLPVLLWWPDDPPFGRARFDGLIGSCDRVLVDSGTFRDDGGAGLAALAVLAAQTRAGVHDMGWMRLTLWRELLAGLFEHAPLTPELGQARALRLEVVRPRDLVRPTGAALFAGWLGAALGWQVDAPLQRARGSESLVGAFRDRRGVIPVEIRGVAAPADGHLHSRGSLQRVDLELGRPGEAVQARVTREEDHLLATADWHGAEVARQAGRLEPVGDAPYLAATLEHAGPDRVLARSIALAVELLGI